MCVNGFSEAVSCERGSSSSAAPGWFWVLPGFGSALAIALYSPMSVLEMYIIEAWLGVNKQVPHSLERGSWGSYFKADSL